MTLTFLAKNALKCPIQPSVFLTHEGSAIGWGPTPNNISLTTECVRAGRDTRTVAQQRLGVTLCWATSEPQLHTHTSLTDPWPALASWALSASAQLPALLWLFSVCQIRRGKHWWEEAVVNCWTEISSLKKLLVGKGGNPRLCHLQRFTLKAWPVRAQGCWGKRELILICLLWI